MQFQEKMNDKLKYADENYNVTKNKETYIMKNQLCFLYQIKDKDLLINQKSNKQEEKLYKDHKQSIQNIQIHRSINKYYQKVKSNYIYQFEIRSSYSTLQGVMTSSGTNIEIPQRIHYLPMERLDFDIKAFLLQGDLFQKLKQKDKYTLDILCKPDTLRQIVSILSNKPSQVEDQSEHFRLLQVIGEIFTMKDNKEILNAFLGESNNVSNSEFFISTDFRLATEQHLGSESKLENSDIEESANINKDKFFSPNSPMRASINFYINNQSQSSDTYQYFYNSDNVFIDFLDILKVQGIQDPCVQYYFNQIFSSLLVFKPQNVQSLVFEKHENEKLLKQCFEYIGDFDIADVVEKVCFQLYEPSENIPIDYLKTIEDYIIKIIEELLDTITIDIDEFNLQNICKIIRNCIQKCTQHHYDQTFKKFINIMFIPFRVQKYIEILLNSQSTLKISEICKLINTALKLISPVINEVELKANPQSIQQSSQLNNEWLKIVIESLGKIKQCKLEVIDRQKTIATQFEQTIQMFGKEKLSIIDFVFEIIKLNDPFVVNELIMHDYPQKIFFFLFEYEWNNLLHEKIFLIIDYLIKNALEQNSSLKKQSNQNHIKDPNYKLLIHFITHVEIYKNIRKSSIDDTLALNSKIVIKKPNLGFIIKIAESLEKLRKSCLSIHDHFDKIQQEKWIDFCQYVLKKHLDLQKVNLGEYEKQNEIIETQNIENERNIKKSTSKLSERFRKNSGKDMGLFVLNPLNKKFLKNSSDPNQNNIRNPEATPQTSQMQIQSAKLLSRRKMLSRQNEDDEEQQQISLSANRKKVSINVERKHVNSIQSGNQNFNLNIMNINTNKDKQINPKEKEKQNNIQGKENNVSLINGDISCCTIQTPKQSDILDHLDDSWESSTKRIITLGSNKIGGICYDEATQKNKIIKQINNSVNENTQKDIIDSGSDFIMFKRKEENNQTKISSFGAKMIENLNIKKKKFSHDEQNNNQFLLSPRLFQKKKKVKSQPNLLSLNDDFIGQIDDFEEQCANNETFDNQENQLNIIKQQSPINKVETSITDIQPNVNQQIPKQESFQTIKLQPSFSSELDVNDIDSSPTKSPITEGQIERRLSLKKTQKTIQLKQSSSLKESCLIDSINENNQQLNVELPINKINFNKQTSKINSFSVQKSLQRQTKPDTVDTKNIFTKINEEENDSQSDTELSNSKSADSKNDSPTEQNKKDTLTSSVQNINNFEVIIQQQNIQQEQNVQIHQTLQFSQSINDSFWSMNKQTESLTSVQDLFSARYKQHETKYGDFTDQKFDDLTSINTSQKRRKESLYENSDFLSGQMFSPICQSLNKDDTESFMNNKEYFDDETEQSGILSQYLIMNRSINKMSLSDRNPIQDSQEYAFKQSQQLVRLNSKKEYDTKNQASYIQNESSFSTTIALEDKSKQTFDSSINQEQSYDITQS